MALFLHQYQIILLGDRGIRVWTTCTRLLRSSVPTRSQTRKLQLNHQSNILALCHDATCTFVIIFQVKVSCCQSFFVKVNANFFRRKCPKAIKTGAYVNALLWIHCQMKVNLHVKRQTFGYIYYGCHDNVTNIGVKYHTTKERLRLATTLTEQGKWSLL